MANRQPSDNTERHEAPQGPLPACCPPYLVAVVHGGDDLPEEVPGLPLTEAPPLADVIVQLALAGVLHDDHDLIRVLKH